MSIQIDPSTVMGYMVTVMVMVMGMKMMAKAIKSVKEQPKIYGPRGELLTHHSIHGPERERLVKEYGTWAVGRAEAVCPEDDVECVEREAIRLLAAYKKKPEGGYFYWGIEDKETGEIFEHGYPYSTQGRAVQGARAFAGRNIPKDRSLMIRVYSEPPAARYEERKERAQVHEVSI